MADDRGALALEVADRLVELDDLAGVLLGALGGRSRPPIRPRIGGLVRILVRRVASEKTALPSKLTSPTWKLGALEDLEDDLAVAGLAALEQADLGLEVALLLVEPADLADGGPGPDGVGPRAGLQAGRASSSFFSLSDEPAAVLDRLEDRHLLDPVDQDHAAPLGVVEVGDADVGEPLRVLAASAKSLSTTSGSSGRPARVSSLARMRVSVIDCVALDPDLGDVPAVGARRRRRARASRQRARAAIVGRPATAPGRRRPGVPGRRVRRRAGDRRC